MERWGRAPKIHSSGFPSLGLQGTPNRLIWVESSEASLLDLEAQGGDGGNHGTGRWADVWAALVKS